MSQDDGDMAAEMMRLMQEKKVPSWYDTLKNAQEMDDVHVHACAMIADLFGLGKEELDPIVDDIMGVGEFMDMAVDSNATLYLGE